MTTAHRSSGDEPSHEHNRTFGIEEEFLLLDARTLTPVNCAAEVILAAPKTHRLPEREFLSSELEVSTPICRTAAEAEDALRGFRTAYAGVAESCGVVLASCGLPPLGGETTCTVTPKSRYQRLRDEMRGVAGHHYAIGTHVHVAVPSRDAGVDVLARLARWAPALLALTANSPLWCGEATGFASWRYVQELAWATAGYPPSFRDGAEYARAVAGLINTGIIIDEGHVTWMARLSHRYPTLELRIADAQLEAGEAVAYAVIVRALVEHALREGEAGQPRPRYVPGLVDGATWLAARNGLATDLTDPLTAETMPAFDLVGRMIATVEDELDRFGDRGRVARYLRRIKRSGSPAARQAAAFASGGVSDLLSLYRAR
ncbi:carboxylate-amine ligase [Leucobacter sp. HY1908]